MFGIKKLRKDFEHLEARYNQVTDHLFGCKNKLMDDVRKNKKDILDLKKEKEDEDREEARKIAWTLYNTIDEKVCGSDKHDDIVKICSMEFFNFLSKNKNGSQKRIHTSKNIMA